MFPIGLLALPLKECISLRIHFFSLNIENTMFPYHMVLDNKGLGRLEGGSINRLLDYYRSGGYIVPDLIVPHITIW